jgi:Rps23 Pro-64 3,4-dihydroxylase Tpa1-like proline 4-hydroxylase
MQRFEIAALVAARLSEGREEAREQWALPRSVKSFALDGLLPEDLAARVAAAFPPVEQMELKHHLGELKYIGVQMNRYDPLVEECLYAFQDPRVVAEVAEATSLTGLMPDEKLYAGGISAMVEGHYLNPHLDNSHDAQRERYRALNLLYYVSPGWRLDYGGNLELWDQGPQGAPRPVESRFNRLVVMQTDKTSWHGVSPVKHPGVRRCVSNYFFTKEPVDGNAAYHVTSFRGRPEEKLKDLLMQGDNALRQTVKELVGERLFTNKHVYKKEK